MRRREVRWVLPLVLLAAVAGCAGQSAQPQASAPVDTHAAEAAIDSLNTQMLAAVAARDTNKVVAMYAEDAEMMPQGMPAMTGPGPIRTGWTGFLQTPGLDMKIQSRRKIVSQAGDLVIDIGTYQMNFKDPKGKPMQDVGKYATTFKKTDSGWKIIVDTFNSDKGPM